MKPNVSILGIQSYIDSILFNFITNSIKYRSDKRDSYVKISSETTNKHVILKIEDNGIGIDLERHRSKLFGMNKTFHNNDDARGIGLFITKIKLKY